MIELYKHNKESYEKIKSMFETENKAAVVQPTGTGKSFLMLKWIEDHKYENIVVLTSSNAILTQIYNYAKNFNCLDIFKNVKAFTYTKFLYMTSKEIKELKADKIIIDEFHRTGAYSWYKKVNILLSSHEDADVLGLSATPIRYLDNARNMIEELLDSNVANEITLGEAVYRGILPKFNYITACYTHDDTKYILDNIKNIPDKKERRKRLKEYREFIFNIEQANKIEDLFRDNIKNKSGKFIVFCKSVPHTKECEKLLKQWFSNIGMKVHTYTSTSRDYNKDEQLEKFINDRSECIKLLLSVNRFNEGLHVEDISGIIMMRPTKSPTMYLQQLGRALSAGKDHIPLVFDLVNNYAYIIPFMENYSTSTSGNPFYDEYTKAASSDYEGNNVDFDIFAQAIKYNELIQELEDKLYFDFSNKWEYNLELYKEFKEKYNREPKNNEKYKYSNIGSWVITQRMFYTHNRLSNERIKKLKECNFLFNKYDNDWECSFNIYKEFKEKYNRKPKNKEKYKDLDLKVWEDLQIKNYKQGKLSEEKIQKLEAIDFIFKNRLEYKWEYNLELYKEFKEKYNREPKNKEKYKGIGLCTWLEKQRSLYNQGKLSEEKIQKLKVLGFIFEYTVNYEWEYNLELYKEFKEKYNREPKVTERYKEINLGNWAEKQRSLYSQGKLSDERIQKLKKCNFDFENNYRKLKYIKYWESCFKLYKEFKEKYNREPKSTERYKEIDLNAWLYRQRRSYNQGKLSEERKQKLESIGVKFD